MEKIKNISHKLHILTGVVISVHGLLRIVFLSKYTSFVVDEFVDIFPYQTVLFLAATLLPFLEFFVGLLIASKVYFKKAIYSALFISLIMGVFIVLKDLYPRLVYHCVVVLLLILVSSNTKSRKQRTISGI